MPKYSHIIFRGIQLTMKEASRMSGLSVRLISNRLSDGWEVERIMTTPKVKYFGWHRDHQVEYSLARQLKESFMGESECTY